MEKQITIKFLFNCTGKEFSLTLIAIFTATNCRHASLGALVSVKLHFLKTIKTPDLLISSNETQLRFNVPIYIISFCSFDYIRPIPQVFFRNLLHS